MKPNYRAMITGNPGIKAEARKLVRKGIIKIGKSDQIKRALKNQGIRVVATNRDGDLQLDMGYLLHIRGDYEGALPFYEQALAIRKKVLGDDPPLA